MNAMQKIEQEIKNLVKAGKPVTLETVDFSDPNRPKTCLEVDFPILPVNQVAVIEGNAGKPVYQMSKWFARRRSSVFRAMLIAAATKAPEDPSHAAKFVWDNYYSNHQQKGSFNSIRVADIFMGGGTTLVEGSRLGMDMQGNDLNSIAWFVVKQEFSGIDIEKVVQLLDDVENEVRPQIIPFFYCDGPNGEKGKWTNNATGKVEGNDFNPFLLTPEERKKYTYEGPEIIYSFWNKHGPCDSLSCGHRTPILSTSVIAIKTLTVKYVKYKCKGCQHEFDIEKGEVRMAPDAKLFVAEEERDYVSIHDFETVDCSCPSCGKKVIGNFKNIESKKVEMSLLLHPNWIYGSPQKDSYGADYGGSPQDDIDSTIKWNLERAKLSKLIEFRGSLPETYHCKESGNVYLFGKQGGTVPKRSTFECSQCGKQQDIKNSISATKKGGQVAGFAVQGFSPDLMKSNACYRGRFFIPFNVQIAKQYNYAVSEWESRKFGDLNDFWPKTEVPFGQMTSQANGNIGKSYGFTHWWTMFNPRQLLVLSQILKSITETGSYDWEIREFVLGAFQQYLNNQNMFCIWDQKTDKLAPLFANNNFHPKTIMVENGVFSKLGRGNWNSASKGIISGIDWTLKPWEIVSRQEIEKQDSEIAKKIKGKSTKVSTNDPIKKSSVFQGSSTDLAYIEDESIDLVITDPPFSGLLHYSELSDFFHVWLRLPLKEKYPEIFGTEYTPKALEAVSNKAREPDDPDGFYKRILTECWSETNRILKLGGILAFTFHHSADAPWLAVLESLFEAGFYLEATYPIRSDEIKGEGEFGSKNIEYDIIHVCRKRTFEPQEVSWPHLRREIISDIQQIEDLLKNHLKDGLPNADIQVIRRGKALEYFSHHYGSVLSSDGTKMKLFDALVGINQIIDEERGTGSIYPPISAEPFTRQFLRIFDGKTKLERDQLQKFLRGSGIAPQDFVNKDWITEKKREFSLGDPLKFAKQLQGKHRSKITNDLDQTLMLIGACFDGSGINVLEILKNSNFVPHPALDDLLEWMKDRGQTDTIRKAALRAHTIYNKFIQDEKEKAPRLPLFEEGTK